jgi:hypothetical protein
MSIKLNFWQTLALFIPFIVSFLLIDLQHTSLYNYRTVVAVANFLLVLSVFIVILYQTYLVLEFNVKSGIKSTILKLNALIPLIFIAFYLIYIGYSTFLQPTFHNYNNGPIKKVDLTCSAWVILLFLIHAFITFYFINTLFVSNKIKAVTDADQQQKLRSDFSTPIRRLTKTSIWVMVAILIISIVIDIIRYSGKN